MNFISTLKSVAAAFFGVQSNDNRKRDLQEGKLTHFIFIGILAVAVFIAALLLIVSKVVPT
ncbi:DUF2970 domain-containing protein [Colwellia sp. E2M01]|uniref:DUF2970 domain-containing protein n=1 Tax=Colwellia sp. E2M01 TaxID=2841561 RepID=UPI001C08F675|nr:DUF2970 domain-containing protein [Colwellia sp. E2M01]MBU2870620.1 DUF2970 domain-containing protein [Colwellia sp. E2M01]